MTSSKIHYRRLHSTDHGKKVFVTPTCLWNSIYKNLKREERARNLYSCIKWLRGWFQPLNQTITWKKHDPRDLQYSSRNSLINTWHTSYTWYPMPGIYCFVIYLTVPISTVSPVVPIYNRKWLITCTGKTITTFVFYKLYSRIFSDECFHWE